MKRPTDRDIPLLRGLLESRVLLLEDIARLYFDNYDVARVRLHTLEKTWRYVAGIYRHSHPNGKPFFGSQRYFSLTSSGLRVLREHDLLDGYEQISQRQFYSRLKIKPDRIGHELFVGTVRSHLESALQGVKNVTGLMYQTWPKLFEFPLRDPSPPYSSRAPDTRVPYQRADSFIHFSVDDGTDEPASAYLYLEYDNNTATHAQLMEKMKGYHYHSQSGDLAVRFHHDKTDKDDFNFLVLFVVNCPRSRERVYNIAENFWNAGIKKRAWIATFDDLRSSPLGQIWIRPQEYYEATRGTPFAPDPIRRRRQDGQLPQRDILLRERLSYISPFDSILEL